MITTIYNEETISKEINTKWAGKTVHFAKETDSTNEWCKRMSKENAEHGTLAVAEFQSAGKGRLGRKWTAPEGSSVMMSILLKPEFEAQYASMLMCIRDSASLVWKFLSNGRMMWSFPTRKSAES